MLFLVTLSTMPSIHGVWEVACPLAAFGGSMRPWSIEGTEETNSFVLQTTTGDTSIPGNQNKCS